MLKIIIVSLWDFENPTLLIWISLEFDPLPVISIMTVKWPAKENNYKSEIMHSLDMQ